MVDVSRGPESPLPLLAGSRTTCGPKKERLFSSGERAEEVIQRNHLCVSEWPVAEG
jgi:hypothetical protein